jgi:hypothetical protein
MAMRPPWALSAITSAGERWLLPCQPHRLMLAGGLPRLTRHVQLST